MSTFSKISNTSTAAASSSSSEEDVDKLRRGPWTAEEDSLLIHCIACHGEGHWNLLAKRSGLKRTGKSCRLRWLNYLKPDVKRGNLTPHEQLLILELHSKWGNRWSRIAQHLPGRTDNEIKNYWRTRVQKQARHLKIDSNSSDFSEIIRCLWMPSLIRKIQRSSSPFATPFENSAKLRSPGSHTLPPPQVSPQFNISSNIWPSDQSMHVTKNHHNLEYPINQFQATGTNSFDMESFSLTPKSAVLPEFCDPTGDELPEKNCWMDGDKLEECLWGIDEIWKLR